MIKTCSKLILAFSALFSMSAVRCEWYAGVAAGISSFDTPGDLEAIFSDLDQLTDMLDAAPGVDASFEFEDEDTAVKIFAGNRINSNLAFEFGYVDLGETTADFSLVSDGTSFPSGTTTAISAISVDGFNAGVVGILPLSDSASLNGRAGIYLWDGEAEFVAEDTTGDFTNEAFSGSDDGNDVYYGLGLDIGWFGFFYETYDIDGDDVNLIGVSARLELN
jgi:hypothetical protein